MVLTKLSETAQVLDPGNEAFNLGIRRCQRTLRELLPINVFQVVGLVPCAFATKWKVNVNRFITASNNTIIMSFSQWPWRRSQWLKKAGKICISSLNSSYSLFHPQAQRKNLRTKTQKIRTQEKEKGRQRTRSKPQFICFEYHQPLQLISIQSIPSILVLLLITYWLINFISLKI